MTFTYILLHSGFECLWCTSSFKKKLYLSIAYSPNNSYSERYLKNNQGLGKKGVWQSWVFEEYERGSKEGHSQRRAFWRAEDGTLAWGKKKDSVLINQGDVDGQQWYMKSIYQCFLKGDPSNPNSISNSEEACSKLK